MCGTPRSREPSPVQSLWSSGNSCFVVHRGMHNTVRTHSAVHPGTSSGTPSSWVSDCRGRAGCAQYVHGPCFFWFPSGEEHWQAQPRQQRAGTQRSCQVSVSPLCFFVAVLGGRSLRVLYVRFATSRVSPDSELLCMDGRQKPVGPWFFLCFKTVASWRMSKKLQHNQI